MPRFIARSCAILLSFAAAAMADTVILKNGEKIEGRILEETDAQVTVEIKISASIKDERVIKRAEIDKIDKVKPDEEAWALVKGLSLGEDSFDAADYQTATYRLGDFVSKFPQSPHLADAKAKLAQFEEERKRVEGGDLKEKGKWLTKEEVKEESVQIKGRVMLSRMKRLAAAGQFSDAMNVYDALEKNFPGAFAVPDAIELARQILPQLKVAADAQKQRLEAQTEANKKRLDVAQGTEHDTLAAMLRNQTAAAEAAVTAAEKSGLRWLPLNPGNNRSLMSLSSKAASEISSMNSRPVDKMRQSIRASENLRAALASGDLPTAEKSMSEAQGAWSNNELARRLQPKLQEARAAGATALTEAAQAKAKAEEAARIAAAAPKPKPTPSPSSTSGSTGVVDDAPRVQESPFYTQPITYVVLVLLGLFGGLGMWAYRKFRDPNKNLLDQ